jgi:hypothetical protein
MRRLIALCVLLMTAACGTTTTGGTSSGGVTPGGTILAPMPVAAWDANPSGKEWTVAARASIEAAPALIASVPKDISVFCPAYATAQPEAKRDFWVVLMSAVGQVESGLNPTASKTVAGGEIRRGLFAISTAAATRYGCTATTAEQLADPMASIACAARILSATSGADSYVTGYDGGWRGAGKYWLEIRKPDGIATLQEKTNMQAFCRPPRRES